MPGGDTTRVKRLVTIGVVTAIAISYVGPVRGYFEQREALRVQREALRALEARRDRLAQEVKALSTLPVLEQRARRLGMVRPGEHAFVIQGLDRPARPARRAREGALPPGLLPAG